MSDRDLVLSKIRKFLKVDAADIAGDCETVWDDLRERYGRGVPAADR